MSKIILITGASSGLGKATAEKFAAGGWDLILTARRKEQLATVASDIEKRYGVKTLSLVFDVQDKKNPLMGTAFLLDEQEHFESNVVAEINKSILVDARQVLTNASAHFSQYKIGEKSIQAFFDYIQNFKYIFKENNILNFDFIAFGKFGETKKGERHLWDPSRINFFEKFV